VSRLILLIVMVTWLGGQAAPPQQTLGLDTASRLSLLVAGFALIVLIPALWSRVLARYVAISNLHKSLARFGWGTLAARALIPVWFAVGVFALGWVEIVERSLGPVARLPLDLPAAVVGTMPAMLAWMALWWAAYPADRALREQSLLLQLQDDLPVHAPPHFWKYFAANLRMQLLFTVVPVLLILFVRDFVALALWLGLGINLDAARLSGATGTATEVARAIEWGLIPLSAAMVFFVAPEILRRVLDTRPLPDSSLRRRLEEMCRRSGLRYREILLWRTGNNVANAAVMGVLPQVRYILLSDLLLESMTEKQVEAVFAHEAGHVVHRHIAWYGAFVVIAIVVQLMLAKLAEVLDLRMLSLLPPWLRDPLILALAVACFFLVFGALSRWFERQADVYAARTMERELHDEPVGVRVSDLPEGDANVGESVAKNDLRPFAPPPAARIAPDRDIDDSAGTQVGPAGARVFASALHRVAVINNIPVEARNFSHGSIADRVSYLRRLGQNPAGTARFDRFMSSLFGCLTLALLISLAWVAVMIWKG
jgi:STE24 endopeptidase